MSRAGRLLIALAYLLAQAYSLGHEAFERHAADCCANDGLARLQCGDDCDQSDHHHHRPHARCAACAKSIVIVESAVADFRHVTTEPEASGDPRFCTDVTDLGPGAPRAPPVAA